jgi:hypothetical protein
VPQATTGLPSTSSGSGTVTGQAVNTILPNSYRIPLLQQLAVPGPPLAVLPSPPTTATHAATW